VDSTSHYPPAALPQRPARVAGPRTSKESWFSGWFSALKGVRWSLAYVGLLLYTVIITTYAFGGGAIVMGISVFAVLLEPKIRLTGMLAWFGGLLVWAFLTHFGSLWPAGSKEALTNLGKVWLIAFVATSTLTDRKRIRLFMLLSVAAYALYPVRGALFNYFLGGYTIFGRALWNHIYRNPNDLAALTLLQLSIAAALYVSEPKGPYKLGAMAALLVLPLLILLTQSRGAFVGLLFFAGAAFTAHKKKVRLVALGAGLLLGAWLVLPSSAWERFSMVSVIGQGGSEVLEELDDRGSAAQRYAIWGTARRIIADNPVQGVGWGNYARANAIYSPQLGARDSHSTYLNLLAEVGVTGFLLFVALIAAVVLKAETSRKRIVKWDPLLAQQIRFLEIGMLAFLVAAVFASYAKLTFFYFHLALIWALCSLRPPKMPAPLHPPRNPLEVR
jgi:O-antigen ligase